MLKKLFAATLWIFLAFPVGSALAQTGTVTGVVSDSTTGDPLPGVNVVIEGENLGAATNANGQYNISNVPTGTQTLVASYVGYQTERRQIEVQSGENQVDILLAEEAIGLEDIVVTALGIEREERSLGYSVDEVEGADLDRVPETNFISNLSGQISGARISSSSNMGGSSRIVLRGESSITGENSPLIVIDGVPLDNSDFNSGSQARGVGGYDYGNAASVINPADVQSVTVLKGPSAAALYGSRAANGVIEITTRSGAQQEALGVTVQSGFTFRDLYNLADYQNEYGGGSFAPFSENEQGQLVPDYGTDQSWGPPLDGREVREWFSWDEVNGMMGQTSPWDPHPDNIKNFFQTGGTWNTNVAFSQGGENFNYRASVNNVTESGVSPESRLQRNNISFNGSLDLSDRLTTSLSANFVDQDAEKQIGAGYSDNVGPFQQFNTFGQRQIDLSEGAPMRDMRRPDGTQRSWNWANNTTAPITGDIIYMNNPFWTVLVNYPTSDMQRIYGNFRLSYDLMDDLTLSGSARTDYYTRRMGERVAVGSQGQPTYSEDLYEVRENTLSSELTYSTDLDNNLSLEAVGGTSYRYANREMNLASTEGGLSTPGIYTLENSVSRPSITDYFQEQGIFGLYADATVGYQDILYVGGSVRNDWSSTLPEENNSYFYPSVRSSFVFSSLPALQDQNVLSYGKLRLSWAQVGRDTNPYELSFTYPGNTPFDGRPLQSLPNTLPNTELKPEIKTGWEIGTQLQFFNNRIGLDATYYRDETENQILAVGRSAASGFTSQQINTGVISNEGVELSLDLTPVLTESFRWDFTVNWATNENTVEELAEGRVTIPNGTAIGGFGPNLVAQEGEPLGSFFGSGFVYNESGEKVLTSGGTYATSDPKILGSYQPDWTGGLRTTLAYEGFSATALVDGQKGGQIWSLSNLFGGYSGLFEMTVEDDIRELGVVPQGVMENGEPFEGRLSAPGFFQSLFGNHEAHLYSATHLKLREVSLSYTFPAQWFAGVPSVQGLTLSAVGRNLATLYKETPNFDPSSVLLSTGNAQGIEAGQLPPVRSYGFSFRLTL